MKFVLLLAGFLSISIANDCAEGQVLVKTKCYNQNDLEILVEFADSSNLFINNSDLDINDKYEFAINMGEQDWDETARLTSWAYWVGVPSLKLEFIPSNIGGLTNLIYLDLSSNHLSGQIPESIWDLTNLVTLDLSGNNHLSGQIPESIGGMTNLNTLDLSSDDLSGQIPESIGGLTSLNILDLARNDLSGQIPESIGGLTSLNTLDLSSNDLSRPIPESIGGLTSLNTLDLSSNDLSGQIPESIGSLINLTELYLAYNFIGCYEYEENVCITHCDDTDLCTGNIPDVIGNLRSLNKLSLHQNLLSGEIPESIGNLINLKQLYLYQNLLRGEIPDSIENLINLTYLNLSTNELSGEIPESIGGLINLTYLNLSNNELSGEIPDSIENLINLHQLYLSNNNLSGDIPETICPQLFAQFDVAYNSFCPPHPECWYGNHGVQDITNCEDETECASDAINLWGSCHATSNLDVLIAFADSSNLFINNPDLDINDKYEYAVNMGEQIWDVDGQLSQWQYTGYPRLNGAIPPNIGNLTHLKYLDLSSNDLSGQIPESIGDLTGLAFLDLSQNELTGEIRESIGNLTNLISLDLYQNHLKDEIPSSIKNLINLEFLDLSNNTLGCYQHSNNDYFCEITCEVSNMCNGEIPSAIGNLTHLKYLDLSSNDLSGEIPESIGDLTNLVSLDLSSNRLSGEIPESIGDLTNLVSLVLRGDGLSGEIPESIGNLTNLTDLYLSRNQLSGEIPVSIGNLINLEFLELSINNLSGEIPVSIGNLINLNQLLIRKNDLNGPIPESIGNMINLTALNLHSNDLSGEIPESIGDLTNLVSLDLGDNNLSGEISESIGNMISWEQLNLEENNLSGEIPESIGNMINLTALDLSDNNLSGEIPESFGNLIKLNLLYIDDNNLSGGIPESIGNLISLDYFKIANNNLSGPIPESICLTSLRFYSSIMRSSFRNNKLCPQFPECLVATLPVEEQDTSDCPSGCADDGNMNPNDWAAIYDPGNPENYPGVGACNYDAEISWDVGECEYFDLCGECGDYDCAGCLDASANNYDPDATETYEGSCQYFQLGLNINNNIVNNYNPYSISGSWGDYDNDGFLDLFIGTKNELLLFHNKGNGDFLQTTQLDSLIGNQMIQSSSWIDYDNNGLLDLFLSTHDGALISNDNNCNDGDCQFTNISILLGAWQHPSWADLDNDGDLDHIAIDDQVDFIYLQNNDSTFTEKFYNHAVPNNSNLGNPNIIAGSSIADVDNDGDLDILILRNGGEKNTLLLHSGDENNDGLYDVTFEKVDLDLSNDEWFDKSMTSSWGDYDNDGDLDLFIGNIESANFLYNNNGDGTFEKILDGDVVNDGELEDIYCTSQSSSWGDYDNDGYLDLFVANYCNQTALGVVPSFLYHNNGDGTFAKILDGDVANDNGLSRGASWADYDNDGDLDLFVANDFKNYLYENFGNENHWINIKLNGGGSNSSAIGSRVRVKANISGQPIWQMRELFSQTGAGGQNSLNAEFGLGDAGVIDSIVVEWSSGLVWDTTNVSTDQFLIIKDSRIAGCMDDGQQAWSPYPGTEACNYSANAQVNNGNCRYIDECGYCFGTSTFNQHLDCNSVCFGDDDYMGQFLTPSDSLYNIHSPNNGIDSCGECAGDDDSCIASLYITNLTVVENSDEDNVYLLDVYMNSVLDVAGYQFDVAGYQLINAYGGSSIDNNFTVLAAGYRVLGFNVIGVTIPAGDNLLVQVELFVNNSATQICLDQIILSDINGDPMNLIEHPGQCITLGCSDPLACNYNEASSYNFNCQFPPENYDCDGNCINMDCAGICGGDTIEDICGVCDPCGNNIEGPCVDSTTGTDPWNDCEKVVYGISSVNRNLGTLDIFIENTIAISGIELWFNNNISLLEEGWSGGLLEEYDFNVVGNTAHHFIGYSLSQDYIPEGSGLFTTLHFDADISSLWPVCFINQSATGNISIDPLQDCYFAGCTDINQCNYNDEADIDDGSCTSDITAVGGSENGLDCAGVCGGASVLDSCGNCNGDCFNDGNSFNTCSLDNENNIITADCTGECGGSAVIDDCGNCDGDCFDDGNGFVSCGNNQNNLIDVDECGKCAGPNLDCVLDLELGSGSSCPDMDYCGVCFGGNDCVAKLIFYKPSDSILDSIIDIKTDSIFFHFNIPVQYQESESPIYINSERMGEIEFTYVTGVTLADSIIAIVFNQPLLSYDSLTIIFDPCKIKNFSTEDINNLYCLSNNLAGIPEPEVNSDKPSIGLNTALFGDYDYNYHIDQYDLDVLLNHWKTDDYNFELGPNTGMAPYLQADNFDFDQDYNLDDLMAFVQMWNWSFENSIAREIVHNPTLTFMPQYSFDRNLFIIDLAPFPSDIKRILLRSDLSGTDMTINSAVDNGQYDVLLQGYHTEGHFHEWVVGSFTSVENTAIGLFNVHTGSRDDQLFTLEYEIIGSNQESAAGEMQINYHPVPYEFSISKAYPNPFNPVTIIDYGISETTNLSIGVYDIRGRQMNLIVKNAVDPGFYNFSWDASAYSSGIYLIKFQISDMVKIQRVLLLK